MKPKVEKTITVVENPWTRIVKEDLILDDGNKGEYIIFERTPAIAIIPLFIKDGEPYTALVKQYRYPIDNEVFQFPMGSMEKGADQEKHAADELRQETGLKMKKITLLKTYYVDPGLSRQTCVAYVAEGISSISDQELEETERGMTVHFVPVNKLVQMIENGEICDSWGIAQVFLLLDYLKIEKIALVVLDLGVEVHKNPFRYDV